MKRILAVSSGGGHWTELMRIGPAFEGHDVAFATVDTMYKSETGTARFYTIADVTRWNKFRWFQVLIQMLFILIREKPDIVISTGAMPGFLALRLARIFGAKTIWLDSIANVDQLSMSGRLAGKYADLWLTQWPHLALNGGPLYRGTVV
ncbi:MAG: UDP-N-acetylglucosamine--LPS N-acetylglucosamine transferase [Steroidobacteraceae bacterium]